MNLLARKSGSVSNAVDYADSLAVALGVLSDGGPSENAVGSSRIGSQKSNLIGIER